jgi:outer membrane protein OmpA-like peptidoglycan-associated protein
LIYFPPKAVFSKKRKHYIFSLFATLFVISSTKCVEFYKSNKVIMKRRLTAKINPELRVQMHKFALAGFSFSILILLLFILFFYFNSSDKASAGTQGKPGGKSRGLFTKSRNVVCKPASKYKKRKSFKLKLSLVKNSGQPYRYVYNHPISRSLKPVVVPIIENDEDRNADENLTASLNPTIIDRHKIDLTEKAKVQTFSHLKLMNQEARNKAILEMTPSKVLPPIRFIFNQDEFSVVNMDSFMEALENINQGYLVLIEGHTDDLGSSYYNLNLSIKRVEKIRELLLQAGADPGLITIKGFGEEKPIVPNINDENRQINRRIEFKVFEM